MLIFKSPHFFFPPTAAIGAPCSDLQWGLAALYRLLRHSVRQSDNDSATLDPATTDATPPNRISMYQLPRHRATAASQKFLILSYPETSNPYC